MKHQGSEKGKNSGAATWMTLGSQSGTLADWVFSRAEVFAHCEMSWRAPPYQNQSIQMSTTPNYTTTIAN